MKKALVISMCLLSLILSGCVDSERIDELENENRELKTKIDDLERGLHETKLELIHVKSQANDVNNEFKSLKRYVEQFDYYDWQLVVPDVRSATSKVDSSLEDLNSKLDDLERKIDNAQNP